VVSATEMLDLVEHKLTELDSHPLLTAAPLKELVQVSERVTSSVTSKLVDKETVRSMVKEPDSSFLVAHHFLAVPFSHSRAWLLVLPLELDQETPDLEEFQLLVSPFHQQPMEDPALPLELVLHHRLEANSKPTDKDKDRVSENKLFAVATY